MPQTLILTDPQHLDLLTSDKLLTFATVMDNGYRVEHQISVTEYNTAALITQKMSDTLAQVAAEFSTSTATAPIPTDVRSLVDTIAAANNAAQAAANAPSLHQKYAPLVSKWATLSGKTQDKLIAINAATVPGANIDVAVSVVVGQLMLGGAYLTLAGFAQGSLTGDPNQDAALGAAKMLMAMISTPNAPMFGTSDPAHYAAISGMLTALVAAPASGVTQQMAATLLSLAATTVPWWQSSGYVGPITSNDLSAAGGLA